MAIKNLYSAESWQKVYQAFSQVNFSAYDYDTIKLSIIDYLRIYYPENFNDFIESSELIALIESFAYVAEQLAYRMDMLSHENFITTAQRKQSILKLAKLISYAPSRNIPARGLVKITTITTTESIVDSQGNNLAGIPIIWNDPNNTNWKEQFFLVFNRTITGKFGQFSSFQEVGDVSMQLYSFNNTLNSIPNGIFTFTVDTGLETFPMEVVPVLLDRDGPYEKTPDINSQLSVVYANDGLGDGSDYTGFLMYIKQGILSKIEYTIADQVPNRSLTLAPININETDVWVTRIDNNGTIEEVWEQVDAMADQNLTFNLIKNRKKFEVETLENDAIKLLFGDGDYSDIPIGSFYFWVRQSANRALVIPPNKLVNQPLAFQYVSTTSGMAETCSITFSLTSTVQNSSSSESIEHIRQSAPATFYSQNRMVNAQDYNTYMLKDPSILRLVSINRTFAGQPKYIEWNDASGQYQNVKIFGDDLELEYNLGINSINTGTSVSSRSLIDEIIEPLLSSTGMINLLGHLVATNPTTSGVVTMTRRHFIEDNRQLYLTNSAPTVRNFRLEKSEIQGALDRHWYGEPSGFTTINGLSYAIIQDPGLHPEDDGKIWLDTVPRTIDGINSYLPGDTGSGLQPIASQAQFGLAYECFTPIIGSNFTILGGKVKTRATSINGTVTTYEKETITIEVGANAQLFYITSNIRGRMGIGEIGNAYVNDDIELTLVQSTTYPLAAGDAFKIDLAEVVGSWTSPQVFTENTVTKFNLQGRWKIINGIDLVSGSSSNPNALSYDPNQSANAWIIWIKANLNPVTQQPTSFAINYRDLQLIARSQNTKFWYNSNDQIIDSETKNRVFDLIRILRSNVQYDLTRPLSHNDNYDVVGPVVDSNGVIDLHALQIIPSDMLNALDLANVNGSTNTSGNTLPDNVLQFSVFANASTNNSVHYVYYQLNSSNQQDGPDILADDLPFDPNAYFNDGSFVSSVPYNGKYYGRTLRRSRLDFMWQHFTPYSNLIDPSVSNIQDTYILTQGYYNAITDYIQGRSNFKPNLPTPLELRNQYSDLLDNKMISDTIVLHPGKLKLLFGTQADPQLRAKFKVVKSPSATMSSERLKVEILAIINSYFSIQNWDFGEMFYATELFSLIHQRLPTEIASVVLVPVYAVNSFGSLFSVNSGIDEILQSAAQLDDIELVSELNATTLRQSGVSV